MICRCRCTSASVRPRVLAIGFVAGLSLVAGLAFVAGLPSSAGLPFVAGLSGGFVGL